MSHHDDEQRDHNHEAAAAVDPGGKSRIAVDPLIVARSEARFSPCGHYRYWLSRAWGEDGDTPQVLWIMMNPSTADPAVNDPTVNRCQKFARRWGYAGFTVVNIFALRSTDPDRLTRVSDPVGPENDATIRDAVTATCDDGGIVVCAWGASTPKRGRAVVELLRATGRPVHALDWAKNGAPKHPLYLRGDLEPIPWDLEKVEV